MPVLPTVQNQLRQGAAGEMTRIQTTFIEIVVEQTLYRIDFRGKREFSAKAGAFSSLEILDQHPLLLDYTEPMAELYFTDAPYGPEALLVELQTAVDTAFEGWRDLKRYLNPLMLPEALLRSQGGMLLRSPLSLVLQAQFVAEAQGMRTSVTTGKAPAVNPRLLLLHNHYVIAEQFTIQRTEIINSHV